jgi:hypothetical protein
MPQLTLVLAVLLIVLGLVCRAVSDSPSVTVLVPAIIGGLFLIAGLIALKPGARKHAMHGAALLAVLAILGSVGGLIKLPALITGSAEVKLPLAVIARSITFVLCAAFLVLAVRSFIAARRARLAAAT